MFFPVVLSKRYFGLCEEPSSDDRARHEKLIKEPKSGEKHICQTTATKHFGIKKRIEAKRDVYCEIRLNTFSSFGGETICIKIFVNNNADKNLGSTESGAL